MWMSHRQQVANQQTERVSHRGRGGAGQAGAKVEWVSAKAIAVHRPLPTHKHKHTQFQASCHLLHFLLNEWGPHERVQSIKPRHFLACLPLVENE